MNTDRDYRWFSCLLSIFVDYYYEKDDKLVIETFLELTLRFKDIIDNCFIFHHIDVDDYYSLKEFILYIIERIDSKIYMLKAKKQKY